MLDRWKNGLWKQYETLFTILAGTNIVFLIWVGCFIICINRGWLKERGEKRPRFENIPIRHGVYRMLCQSGPRTFFTRQPGLDVFLLVSCVFQTSGIQQNPTHLPRWLTDHWLWPGGSFHRASHWHQGPNPKRKATRSPMQRSFLAQCHPRDFKQLLWIKSGWQIWCAVPLTCPH